MQKTNQTTPVDKKRDLKMLLNRAVYGLEDGASLTRDELADLVEDLIAAADAEPVSGAPHFMAAPSEALH